MGATHARIIVAEHWSILRRGIIGTLQGRHTVIDGFDDVADLALCLSEREVDLAVIGSKPSVDAAAVVARLREIQPTVHVVVLCDNADPAGLRAVLRSGASAVLSRKLEDAALLDAVARVLDGERVVDQPFLPLLFGGAELAPADDCTTPSPLTRREHDVLLQLARGVTNREIARILFMSESTVKTHLRQIYAKLEVSGRHRAVGRAMELELLT